MLEQALQAPCTRAATRPLVIATSPEVAPEI